MTLKHHVVSFYIVLTKFGVCNFFFVPITTGKKGEDCKAGSDQQWQVHHWSAGGHRHCLAVHRVLCRPGWYSCRWVHQQLFISQKIPKLLLFKDAYVCHLLKVSTSSFLVERLHTPGGRPSVCVRGSVRGITRSRSQHGSLLLLWHVVSLYHCVVTLLWDLRSLFQPVWPIAKSFLCP